MVAKPFEMNDFEVLKHELLTDPNHGDQIRFALEKLGNPEKKLVLDSGCGAGTISCLFALQGASVIGIDVDQSRVEAAQRQAQLLAVSERCQFMVGNSEVLPLRQNSVDCIFSKSTIQYMDRERVLGEYMRVLRPGGIVLLLENLPGNPLVVLYRLYRKLFSWRKADIDYLNSIRGYITLKEISTFADCFTHSEHREYHLFRILSINLRWRTNHSQTARTLDNWCASLDGKLLRTFPSLRRFAWYTALYGQGLKETGATMPYSR
jgi:ubiquinone/menaquinone biosynthesis C-methylase UbiE